VVTDPQVGQPETAQRRLGRVDLGQLVRRDLLEVRDPGGEARSGRLVRRRQVEGAGDAPDGGLVEAGVRQRREDAVLARGRARTVGPRASSAFSP
jgi:hypothetical protein